MGIDSIVLKPRNLSFAQAACLPLVGLTSIGNLRQIHLILLNNPARSIQ